STVADVRAQGVLEFAELFNQLLLDGAFSNPHGSPSRPALVQIKRSQSNETCAELRLALFLPPHLGLQMPDSPGRGERASLPERSHSTSPPASGKRGS